MEQRAKVTSKGQVTVPVKIRQTLGLQTGDELVFDVTQDGVKVRALRHQSPFAKYMGIGNPELPSGRKALLKALRTMRGR